jgi:hypothetical protein
VDLFVWLESRWRDVSNGSKTVFTVSLAANFLAFGFLFANLSLNHDGFGFITIDGSWARSTGRWATDILYAVFFRNHQLIWLHGILGSALFVATGMSVCRTLGVRLLPARLIVVLLYSLFPYMCSYYGYAFHVPIYAFACLLVHYSVELACKGARGAAVGSVLVMLSLACYQAFIASAATLALAACAAELAKADGRGQAAAALRMLGRAALMFVSGGVLYAVSIKISTSVFNIQLTTYQGAAGLLSFDWAAIIAGLPSVAWETARFLGMRLPSIYPESLYFTPTHKLMCLAVYAAAFAGLWASGRMMAARIGACALFLAALFAPRAVQVFHPGGNYHELTLTGYGVFIAASAAFAMNVSGRWPRTGVQAVVALLIAGFLHSNNVGASALVFDYQAIMHWGNRILARVEQHPRYSAPPAGAVRKAVFVGDLYKVSEWYYRGRPFVQAVGIADGVPNIIFDAIFRLLRVNASTDGLSDGSRRQAAAFAAGRPAWPHPDSVTVLEDGTIVVILDNSPAALKALEPH